jgi:hypothetical protein
VPAVGHREADPARAISHQPEQPMPPTGSAPEPELVHADDTDTREGSAQPADTRGDAPQRADTGNLVQLRPSVADVRLAESDAGPQLPAKARSAPRAS